MDPRRINDFLKLIGAAGAMLAAVAPFVPHQYATVIGAISAFLAGVGTRGFGLEYKDVAEAKIKASLVPPPMTVAPPAADDPPSK